MFTTFKNWDSSPHFHSFHCVCLVVLLMISSETDKMKRAWTLVCGSIKEGANGVIIFCFATKAQKETYSKKERALASYTATQLYSYIAIQLYNYCKRKKKVTS